MLYCSRGSETLVFVRINPESWYRQKLRVWPSQQPGPLCCVIVSFGGDTDQMLRTTAPGYLLFHSPWPLFLSFLHVRVSWELLKTLIPRPDFRPIESKSSPGIRTFDQGDYNMPPSLRTGVFYLFFLNVNGHMDFLGILLMCRFWFSCLRWGMRFCITNKRPGGAVAAGLGSYIE